MNLPQNIRIATRTSKLALIQAELIRSAILKYLEQLDIHCQVELLPLQTSGDKAKNQELFSIGGKGLFTKEIEEALLAGDADIAMHSLKDMPAQMPDELIIAGCLPREDYKDAIIANGKIRNLADLVNLSSTDNCIIGTSSPRRAAQIKQLIPKAEIVSFRGNVPTRLQKLADGEVTATILAVAGLKRLGLQHHITFTLHHKQMLPAIGQGIIAMQCHNGNTAIRQLLENITHIPTWKQAMAERAILTELEGDCRSPIAGLAQIMDNNKILVSGLILNEDGHKHYGYTLSGDISDAYKIGRKIGKKLLAKTREIWSSDS